MLLLDLSAFARLTRPGLPSERTEQVARWMRDGEFGVCLPFLLEAGYSTRSGRDQQALLSRLALLPRVPITEGVERAALSAQSRLARVGHHRLAPSDLIIAACAQEAGAGVMHYDADYDILAERSGLRFHSEWLAPRGSVA